MLSRIFGPLKIRLFLIAAFAVVLVSNVSAADDVVSAVHGTIGTIDATAKTIVVKTPDGTRHLLRFADQTAIHGTRLSSQVAKGSWHGVTKGSEVIAHTPLMVPKTEQLKSTKLVTAG